MDAITAFDADPLILPSGQATIPASSARATTSGDAGDNVERPFLSQQWSVTTFGDS